MLLVAGPSGAGKTAFMRHLRERRLPPEIRDELPDGCDEWERVQAFELSAFLEGYSRPGTIDIVFHYDIMRALYCGLPTLLEDPPVASLSDVATIVAVTLRTPPERLWYQLGRRSFGGASPDETRALVHQAKSAETLDKPQARHLPLLADYARGGFLESWFDQWRAILDSLASDGILVKEIDIATSGNIYDTRAQGWALLGAVARARSEIASAGSAS